MNTQRRHFSRIAFNGEASFSWIDRQLACEVLDVSLKGALVTLQGARVAEGTPCMLELRLADDAVVRMEGHVAHAEGTNIGIACEDIDLDSITHLRRLIELNLSDPALLERELAALISG